MDSKSTDFPDPLLVSGCFWLISTIVIKSVEKFCYVKQLEGVPEKLYLKEKYSENYEKCMFLFLP